ncbi:putative cysteine-rich receptor-like protein kinase 9 [Spinacia oleracea]|uniref:Cysteine-rich receptor-like protein kinase 9 n=1 Tax=Spinacia oleracea TaxID=3562 RepID=A0ABM3QWY8_SPIOL|nr:putative cysteine-rich receptor-like protein kinase 9 [Spinacia oleracea]
MKLLISTLILITIICSFNNHEICAQEALASICYGNWTDNLSTYQNYSNNVYSLISLLASKSSSSSPGFLYNTSVGEVAPRAYGSYLCRGDLEPRLCQRCVSDYEDGRWLDSDSIGEEVEDYHHYNETLSMTIQKLIIEAAFGNWTKRNFETKIAKNVYVLVQCTGELYSRIPDCCNGTQGGYVAYDWKFRVSESAFLIA